MSSLPDKLKPVNRHLLVIPHTKEKQAEDRGIVLPEDYNPKQERYIAATVVDVAPDCAPHFRLLSSSERREVVVDSGMIEKTEYKGKAFHFVLENYVIGIVKAFHES